MEWETCCRGRRSACPEVAVEGQVVHIRDDHGGQVQLTLAEFCDVQRVLIAKIAERDSPPPAKILYLPDVS